MYFPVWVRWILIALVCGGLCYWGPATIGQNTVDVQDTPITEPNKQREGTRVIGLTGNFQPAVRRWTFVTDSGNVSYRVLENLSLERVARAFQEDAHDRHWKVSGVLTEFMDENFLLIDRIERAANTSPNQ